MNCLRKYNATCKQRERERDSRFYIEHDIDIIFIHVILVYIYIYIKYIYSRFLFWGAWEHFVEGRNIEEPKKTVRVFLFLTFYLLLLATFMGAMTFWGFFGD